MLVDPEQVPTVRFGEQLDQVRVHRSPAARASSRRSSGRIRGIGNNLSARAAIPPGFVVGDPRRG